MVCFQFLWRWFGEGPFPLKTSLSCYDVTLPACTEQNKNWVLCGRLVGTEPWPPHVLRLLQDELDHKPTSLNALEAERE